MMEFLKDLYDKLNTAFPGPITLEQLRESFRFVLNNGSAPEEVYDRKLSVTASITWHPRFRENKNWSVLGRVLSILQSELEDKVKEKNGYMGRVIINPLFENGEEGFICKAFYEPKSIS